MPVINVYEPALCCSTGVCGADLDQALVTFTADVDHLRGLGADISRHNLASDPAAFAGNDSVRSFLEVAGSEGLPLTMVDGVTVPTGTVPGPGSAAPLRGPGQRRGSPGGRHRAGADRHTGGSCGPAGCC